ncbi:MAG: ABC transporter substrate-binding protein [Piscirickettsiaceae bacterium]|jgi:phospholipid transport system substrate-binding protein|nr:ABC transporter substrate-binding protein [Piscirickettsiaceae bacterium]
MLKLFVKPVWFTLLLAMVTTLFFSSSAVMADETVSEPQALVKDASDRMLQALKDNEDKIEEDPRFVYGLVDDILLPNFDFAKMSKLALGKNWRKANTAQRERFIGEFRLLLVRTYTTAMLEYSDEEIVFLPFRDDLAKKRVKVAMEILQPGGPSIPMALSMYLNKQNAWKVYDVKIDGISLVTNYRSTFAAEIRQGGMEKLIDNLAARNEKVKA